jgi:type VI secretion system secreted protein Hcp
MSVGKRMPDNNNSFLNSTFFPTMQDGPQSGSRSCAIMKTKPTIRDSIHSRFISMSFSPLLALALTFFSAARVHATEIFLKLEDEATTLPGESRDTIFAGADGWNDVSSFEWKVTADSSWTNGGGASIGKPAPQAVQITRMIDSASPGILAAILTGKVIAKGELVIRDTSRLVNKDSADTVLRYEFTSILFTSVKPAAAAGDTRAVETISFVIKTLKMTYRPVTTDGTLGDPMVVSWDVPAGTVVGP